MSVPKINSDLYVGNTGKRLIDIQDTLYNRTGICYDMLDGSQIRKTSNCYVDTRNDNNLPNWYRKLGCGIYREFKATDNIGLNRGCFMTIETYVQWNDTSGGYIFQIAHGVTNDGVYEQWVRHSYGDDSGWNAWRQLH